MRCLAILLTLATLTPAQAGLYAPDTRVPQPRRQGLGVSIRGEVIKLRAIGSPPIGRPDPDSWQALTEKEVRIFEAAAEERPLFSSERATWAAGLLRLHRLDRPRIDEAIQVLRKGDRSHFLIRANLATAYFMKGELDLAQREQEQLVASWPAVMAGWSQTDLLIARECELAFLRVIRSRNQEARTGGDGPLPLDPVFPGFDVETRDGDYEPGRLPPALRDRLPINAMDILVQLLFWLPRDDRLFWQYGELAVALGHIDEGYQVIDSLVANALNYKGLRQHRRAVKDALELMRVLWPQRYAPSVALAVPVVPTGGAAGAGLHLVSALGTNGPGVLAALEKMDRERREQAFTGPPTPPPVEPPLPFNWRHITASFAFGFLVAALVGFQLQEWRRRARANETAQTPTA